MLLGINGKLYYQTQGTRAAWPAENPPTNLSEIDLVGDVRLNIEGTEAEVNARKNGGWGAIDVAILKATIEADIVWDPADTPFAFLLDAFLTRAIVPVACLDQAKENNGARGLWADCKVTQFNQTQNAEGVQMASVTIKPTLTAVPPEFVTVVVPPNP